GEGVPVGAGGLRVSPAALAALGDLVRVVFGLCAFAEVVGVDARRVVAAVHGDALDGAAEVFGEGGAVGEAGAVDGLWENSVSVGVQGAGVREARAECLWCGGGRLRRVTPFGAGRRFSIHASVVVFHSRVKHSTEGGGLGSVLRPPP